LEKIFSIILIIISSAFISCGNDTILNNNTGDTYQKIITAESGNNKFEVWTLNNDTLMTGYNKVGFKVFENGNEKNSGFVKFYAKMFHFTSNEFHATPVEPVYQYNSSLGMFTGYIIMLMPSDSTSRWYGYYNYNDEFSVDSVRFDAGWDHLTKFKIFTDLTAELSYLITITTPQSPILGFNDFSCLLHESPDFVSFTQVNSANMFLKAKLDSLNHYSDGNVNPVYSGDGIYKGKVNFDYSGGWKVYDSIYYNNRCITQNGTPYIYFEVR
jgi:hypothetical protein